MTGRSCLILTYLTVVFSPLATADLGEKLSITEFIRYLGYPAETHTIQTDDGYVLQMQRIPTEGAKNAAILVHGLGGQGGNYVLIGSDSLAFYLADRGYDVWLFNARGTVHSRRHKSLNPNRDRKKFWDYSFHEIAVNDLRPAINYVVATTGFEKVFYAAHSMGTTLIFVMLSEHPEMNEKIAAAALLAPSVHLQYTRSALITLLTKFQKLGERLVELLGLYELPMPNSPMVNNILMNLCRGKALENVCLDLIYLLGDSNSGLVNKTLLPLLLKHGPSGLASRQLWHYSQLITTGEFKQYDYGKRKNMKVYNNPKAPFYKLNNTRVPLALFYAPDDPFGNTRMIDELVKSMHDVQLQAEIKIPGWNHMDYVLSQVVEKVIHDPLYEVFKKYENS